MIGAAPEQNAMQPSALRPIPMHARSDLVIKRIDYQGRQSYVAKDPVGLKYHRLRPEQFRVLRLLDDQRSLEAIRDELRRGFPSLHLQLTDVQALVSDLHTSGLVHTRRPGQGAAMLGKERLERRQRIKRTFKNFLFLRLPGWDPEWTLSAILPMVRWCFHPLSLVLAGLFVLSAWITLGINFDAFRRDLPAFHQFFGWPNVLLMWITLALCKVVHEFGHGLTCKYFGSECHEMGVMFLVFSPCLYCDVTDSWMLPNKWKRIAIAAAGMAIEIVLSALAIYLWLFSNNGMLKMIALNVFFVTTLTTVIFNLNPLMRFDGYYILSDFLEIPNLRQKADKLLREKFGWHCLGIESKHDPFMPETGVVWFVTYAIAAWAYKWIIMFGIAIFLYTWLKPYGLQSIGATMAVAAIAGMVISPFVALYKMVSTPRVDPLSKKKITLTLAASAVALAAALFIPLPLHIEAPFVIEPAGAQRVYVATPGHVERVLVQPGDHVERGERLAVLSNRQLADELQALRVQRETAQRRLRAYSQIRDSSRVITARQHLDSLAEQIRDLQQRIGELTITAPVAGRVIAPRREPEPSRGKSSSRLPQWSGTPLDPENLGAYLEAGTVLLGLVPESSGERAEAILLIDQADRNEVYLGQPVELRFEHLPNQTVQASVSEFSAHHVQFAPPALSSKFGGPIPTVADPQGRQRLRSHAYRAKVLIDGGPFRLLPGMRGIARLDAKTRTAAAWLWRYLRQTFYFRL